MGFPTGAFAAPNQRLQGPPLALERTSPKRHMLCSGFWLAGFIALFSFHFKKRLVRACEIA